MNFDDMVENMIEKNDCKVYTEQIEVIKMSKATFSEILERMYVTGFDEGVAANKLARIPDWK